MSLLTYEKTWDCSWALGLTISSYLCDIFCPLGKWTKASCAISCQPAALKQAWSVWPHFLFQLNISNCLCVKLNKEMRNTLASSFIYDFYRGCSCSLNNMWVHASVRALKTVHISLFSFMLYHKNPQCDPSLAPPRMKLQLFRSKAAAASVFASIFLLKEKKLVRKKLQTSAWMSTVVDSRP